jgi:hypothetical protein
MAEQAPKEGDKIVPLRPVDHENDTDLALRCLAEFVGKDGENWFNSCIFSSRELPFGNVRWPTIWDDLCDSGWARAWGLDRFEPTPQGWLEGATRMGWVQAVWFVERLEKVAKTLKGYVKRTNRSESFTVGIDRVVNESGVPLNFVTLVLLSGALQKVFHLHGASFTDDSCSEVEIKSTFGRSR